MTVAVLTHAKRAALATKRTGVVPVVQAAVERANITGRAVEWGPHYSSQMRR